jgi:cysteine desulfurase
LRRRVGARPQDVVFSSAGTEANALALTPGLRRGGALRSQRLLVSPSNMRPCCRAGGFARRDRHHQGHRLPALFDLDHLRAMLTGPAALVSVMLANNENRRHQRWRRPIVHCGRRAAACRCDPGFGKIPFDRVDGCDL